MLKLQTEDLSSAFSSSRRRPWLARVEEWRSQQRPIPNRSEAIRMLVDSALHQLETAQ
jgi:hypothetical protein